MTDPQARAMTAFVAPQKRIPHCWEDGPRVGIWPRDCGTSCMLMDGHEGPHEWTRDDQIVVRFAP